VTGDLVHRQGDPEQIAEYKRVMAGIDRAIPVHPVAGNHDVGDSPTCESIAAFRAAFGPDRAAFDHGGSRFIIVDSSLIGSPNGCPAEASEQLRWLRSELDRARRTKRRHVVVFEHHPPFVEKPDEPDGYFCLPLAHRKEYLDLLKRAGVRAVFAGHLHRCAAGKDGELEIVTTGPVGRPLEKDPSGFRIVWVFDDRLEHRYYALDAAPQKVSLRGPGG
jgi:serine/threonine-protein phosphatase CPPED1